MFKKVLGSILITFLGISFLIQGAGAFINELAESSEISQIIGAVTGVLFVHLIVFIPCYLIFKSGKDDLIASSQTSDTSFLDIAKKTSQNLAGDKQEQKN